MGREIVVTPSRWSPRGEAEALVRGRPLRVWSGIVGESAVVRLTHEGQNADYGVLREPRPADPHRVRAACDRYATCGGCPWMHLDAEGQRQGRIRLVEDALSAEGLDDVEIGEFVPSPDGLEDFRWVVKLGIGVSEHGRLRVGAWGRHTRSIVPIPQCHVAAPVVREAMGVVAHHIIDLGIQPYDPDTDRGVLRAIVLRGSRTTGEVLVTLVGGRRVSELSEFATRVVQQCGAITGIALHLNDDVGNAIYQRDEEGAIRFLVLEGRPWIEDTLGDITYRIGPGDFFQTNPGTAEVVYERTLDALDLTEGVPVVDLYSGVGGLALPAARRTGWAIGVEQIAGAVEAARETAKRNDLRAEFLAGDVAEVLPGLTRRLGDARPVVLVNPARRGLEPGVIEGIASLNPRRVAYISCNPRALARDLAAFVDQGMTAEPLTLYDMFPNTAHVEVVAVLSYGEPPPASRRAPRRHVVRGSRS